MGISEPFHKCGKRNDTLVELGLRDETAFSGLFIHAAKGLVLLQIGQRTVSRVITVQSGGRTAPAQKPGAVIVLW
jgi:hypothetical protein